MSIEFSDLSSDESVNDQADPSPLSNASSTLDLHQQGSLATSGSSESENPMSPLAVAMAPARIVSAIVRDNDVPDEPIPTTPPPVFEEEESVPEVAATETVFTTVDDDFVQQEAVDEAAMAETELETIKDTPVQNSHNVVAQRNVKDFSSWMAQDALASFDWAEDMQRQDEEFEQMAAEKVVQDQGASKPKRPRTSFENTGFQKSHVGQNRPNRAHCQQPSLPHKTSVNNSGGYRGGPRVWVRGNSRGSGYRGRGNNSGNAARWNSNAKWGLANDVNRAREADVTPISPTGNLPDWTAVDRPPFVYRIVQRFRHSWVAAHDPPQKSNIRDPVDLPPYVFFTRRVLKDSTEPEFPMDDLLIGNQVRIRYIYKREGYQPQSRHVPVSRYINHLGFIGASATAGDAYKVHRDDLGEECHWHYGIVSAIEKPKEADNDSSDTVIESSTQPDQPGSADDQSEQKIRVTVRFFNNSTMVPLNAIDRSVRYEMGHVVRCHMHHPPTGSLEGPGSRYYLPAKWPGAVDEKATGSNHRILLWVSNSGINQEEVFDPTRLFNRLGPDATSHDFRRVLKEVEDMMLASASRAHEQMDGELARIRHVVRLKRVSDDIVTFTTAACSTEKQFLDEAKYWKTDAHILLFKAPKLVDAKALGKAVVGHVDVDEKAWTFTITASAESADANATEIGKKSALFRMIEGLEESTVTFPTGRTAFKPAKDVFSNNQIHSIFVQQKPVARALAVLLGVPHLAPETAEIVGELRGPNAGQDPLNKEQREAVNRARKGTEPIIFMQSPGGSGKTHSTGQYTNEVYDDHPTERLLVLTPTNQSLINAIKAYAKGGLRGPDDYLVNLSQAFTRMNPEKIDAEWSESRLAPTLARALDEDQQRPEGERIVTGEKLKYAKIYLAKAERGDSATTNDKSALSTLLLLRQPRIIFSTIGMAQRTFGHLSPLIDRIAVDDAGMITEQDFLTVLALFPNTKQVFVAADSHQARVSEFDVPEAVRRFSLFPVTQSLIDRKVPTIELKRIHRFNRRYLEIIAKAIYQRPLIFEGKDSERDFFSRLPLPDHATDIPVLVFDSTEQDEKTLTKSR